MLYYFAPLEGITNSTYRNTYHTFFFPLDKYFTPFFVPSSKQGLSSKDRKELLPELNSGLNLVPQLLTNQSEAFIKAAQQIKALGYEEMNLNLGCPSGTVVSKKRGAGFLADPLELREFLTDIFSHVEIKISIKTRIGVESPREFDSLLKLFNAYPLSELIIHPRIQRDFYRNHPNLAVFQTTLSESKHPVVYSGDLFTKKQIQTFAALFPQAKAVMLGRGLIANPGLYEDVLHGTVLTQNRLWEFHQHLYHRYQEMLYGSKPLLHKMKELWHYMICLFPDNEKHAKRLRKAQTVSDYEAAVAAIFRDLTLSSEAGYHPPHRSSP